MPAGSVTGRSAATSLDAAEHGAVLFCVMAFVKNAFHLTRPEAAQSSIATDATASHNHFRRFARHDRVPHSTRASHVRLRSARPR